MNFLEEHIIVAQPRQDNYTVVRDCVKVGEEFTTEDVFERVGSVLGFDTRRKCIEHINRYLNSWSKHGVMERAQRNVKGEGWNTHHTIWRRVK